MWHYATAFYLDDNAKCVHISAVLMTVTGFGITCKLNVCIPVFFQLNVTATGKT